MEICQSFADLAATCLPSPRFILTNTYGRDTVAAHEEIPVESPTIDPHVVAEQAGMIHERNIRWGDASAPLHQHRTGDGGSQPVNSVDLRRHCPGRGRIAYFASRQGDRERLLAMFDWCSRRRHCLGTLNFRYNAERLTGLMRVFIDTAVLLGLSASFLDQLIYVEISAAMYRGAISPELAELLIRSWHGTGNEVMRYRG